MENDISTKATENLDRKTIVEFTNNKLYALILIYYFELKNR